MSEYEDYWFNRNKSVSRLSLLKTSPFIQWIFSVRVGDEAFLRRELNRNEVKPVVLDIACGVGKVQISSCSLKTYGVDIFGYPKKVAESRRYITREYSPPDFAIDLKENADVLTCIDLNAHIDFQTFCIILRSALNHLRPNGLLLMVCEFDNQGIGYRIMKCFPNRFRRYVLGMKHWHFMFESDFLAAFNLAFPSLNVIKREEIVCIPPMSHFYACFFNRNDNGLITNVTFRICDVLLSLLNNLFRHFSRSNSAFRVGYVIKYSA